MADTETPDTPKTAAKPAARKAPARKAAAPKASTAKSAAPKAETPKPAAKPTAAPKAEAQKAAPKAAAAKAAAPKAKKPKATARPAARKPAARKAATSKPAAKPAPQTAKTRTGLISAITVGLIAAGSAAALFARRFLRPGNAEHAAPDLALDQPRPDADHRAPVDFRPDPTAAVPANEREALRPATLPLNGVSTH